MEQKKEKKKAAALRKSDMKLAGVATFPEIERPAFWSRPRRLIGTARPAGSLIKLQADDSLEHNPLRSPGADPPRWMSQRAHYGGSWPATTHVGAPDREASVGQRREGVSDSYPRCVHASRIRSSACSAAT